MTLDGIRGVSGSPCTPRGPSGGSPSGYRGYWQLVICDEVPRAWVKGKSTAGVLVVDLAAIVALFVTFNN